jgi:hypothetical protein
MPLKPICLGYLNAQILLIGEGRGEIGKAGEQQEEDARRSEEEPLEEMERLEEEDEEMIKGLKGTNLALLPEGAISKLDTDFTGHETEAIFVDLGLSVKKYPKVHTTW